MCLFHFNQTRMSTSVVSMAKKGVLFYQEKTSTKLLTLFTYIWLISMVNYVNIPYMDPMGYTLLQGLESRSFEFPYPPEVAFLNLTKTAGGRSLLLFLVGFVGISI